jgi:AraC-like DNA-binding protein
MPVWLSGGAGVAWLGSFGRHVRAAQTLGEAISKVNCVLSTQLQSATDMRLAVTGGFARWSYQVTDAAQFGRQTNELLAFGYMLDLIRGFAGRGWAPHHVTLPGWRRGSNAIEKALRGDVVRGDDACIFLQADLLASRNPALANVEPLAPLPALGDFLGSVVALTRTSLLLETRDRIGWVANRMAMSRRALQRALAAAGTDFRTVVAQVCCGEAQAMLAEGLSITTVAAELGYLDPAHFSRAFRSWTGQSPRGWRATSAYTDRPGD